MRPPKFRWIVLLCLLAPVAPQAEAQTRVVDGDTLEIDGTIYRLNGIDAPEHGQRCGDWACGSDATNALADLVKGRDVTCQPIAQDRYGRVIATCFTGGRDISAAMIDNGLAWAFLKYSDAYETHQLVSKEKAQGVFSDDYAAPWDFRERRWKAAQGQERDAPSGCPIKGNISENGRIYHAPWSPWYDRTRINEGKGERWFCSESEAVAAGWRAPRWH